MARKDTNKQYSLRKLKTGTASVAVAVAVLGAGFANQTEVKATEVKAAGQSAPKGTNVSADLYNSLWDENKTLREKQEEYITKIQNEETKNKELDKKNKELDSRVTDLIDVIEHDDQELKRKDRMYEAFLKQSKDQVKDLNAEKDTLAEKAKKLEEDKQISDASRQGLSRDLEASRAAKKELEANHQKLEAEHQKLKEDKQISDASRQGLSRDLEASREAKKKVEADLAALTAEHQKLKEEKQISDASRQGLSRDLEASREAKKKVEADLAEAKALKEQLAKQAEELAKLKGNQTPNAKVAPQANRSRSAMTQQKRTLPSTGETANPFFTAAAATVMVSAGMLALKRKEEN
ncbi:TPA: YSIRK-type signal peptide-containing protein [Streptococcus pyogenes]|nr:YSIRK-type signal peptide-containing protein [Streptococcus pyogenes]HER2367844.1 YSIRK-type signal peptide-containing protein [Streptococcus pyogenes]HER2424600.1 YSIRK-type signal peptide-containing protein [Streptococcus pyogenes]HER2427877.1 YSIRK-type signal peptide-containing protein [Streptococcus pyogenes]HES9377932.1 YSIRK-type signal peptide-containing protein [Streptococcus pyogenes]